MGLKLRQPFSGLKSCFSKLLLAFGVFAAGSSAAFAGSLTIYILPTPHGNHLESPRRLAWSISRNYRAGVIYPTGHSAFHLQCSLADGDDSNVDILDGINAQNLNEGINLARFHGYGLGMMFAKMSGHFEGREATQRGIDAYKRNGAVAFVTYRINPSACSRMTAFIQEYRDRGIDQYYGLSLRPRFGEGANCANFLNALLEIGGLTDAGMQLAWNVSLRVPVPLVGGPLTGYFIPPAHFFIRPFWARSWAAPSAPHYAIRFYDPDRLFGHLSQRWSQGLSPLNNGGLEVYRTHNGPNRGFEIDARSLPVPAEPFWLRAGADDR